jgi:cytochrome c peroxidase
MNIDINPLIRRLSRLAYAVVIAAGALLSWTSTADVGIPGGPVFTPDEVKRIISHGPWPAPAPSDATNRVSGKPAAIELGTRLFFDQRLSSKGQMACATCHVPERNWTDNLKRAVGMVEVDRNTPTLFNLRAGRWYGWDGAADSLWSQSLRPILDERELAATPRHVAQLVRGDEQLSCRYVKAFGAAPPVDDETVFVNVGKALASFQETLTSGRTPFDHFRDALARGDAPSTWTYSEAAQRGLKLFIGKGACTNCHAGPNFTGGEFFATGLSKYAPHGKPDPGRHTGVARLLKSRFNLAGPYNDDPLGEHAARTKELTVAPENFGEFKVPSLRNLLLTSPYGRDGSVETLAEVVRHYAGIDPAALHAKDGRPAQPLNLTAREQSDLIVFLESLSTFSNPWRPEDGVKCQ